MSKSENLEMESFHGRNGASEPLKIKILFELSRNLLMSKRYTFLSVIPEKKAKEEERRKLLNRKRSNQMNEKNGKAKINEMLMSVR